MILSPIHSSVIVYPASAATQSLSSVVPHTIHSSSLYFIILFCITTYSSTSLTSVPSGSGFPSVSVFSSVCLLRNRTIACLIAHPPKPGICDARCETTFGRPTYSFSVQRSFWDLGRREIRAENEAKRPSVQVLRSVSTSPLQGWHSLARPGKARRTGDVLGKGSVHACVQRLRHPACIAQAELRTRKGFLDDSPFVEIDAVVRSVTDSMNSCPKELVIRPQILQSPLQPVPF